MRLCYSRLMKRGTVIIPESPLDAELAKLARLKQQAQVMLAELEQAAGSGESGKSGGWRHNPVGWMNRPKP